ncbi:MAG: hypothetical protein PHN39_00215 [Candidatus Pacebacteria bacterium]|nr:hypothetical protein [Candidatus Paceibacterota bacterium]
MTSKIITIAVIVLLGCGLVGAVVYDSINKKSVQEAVYQPAPQPAEPSQESASSQNALNLPEPTGNIDDVVSAFLQEVNSENNILAEENIDTSFVTSDSEVIGDIGQSTAEDGL